MSKNCITCNKVFYKKKNTSLREWNTKSKYCSHSCYSSWLKNPELSKDWREKISTAHIGKPGYWTGKHRFFGDKHWSWKGGITPINIAIRNSIEYEEWRTKVFERDLYTCQKCDQKGGYLQADHIKRFADYPDLRFELSNGQTLCIDCHKLKTIEEGKLYWKNQYSTKYDA